MTEIGPAWRRFKKSKTAIVGLSLSLLVVLSSLLGPIVISNDPLAHSMSSRLEPPSSQHPFGTDGYGRDVFSRVIHGGRVSLAVGFGSIGIGLVIGTLYGMLAAMAGRHIEVILMRAIDVLMTFPTLIMGLVVMVILGRGIFNLVLAIGLTWTPRFARIAYGCTKSLASADFIIATKAIGVGRSRVIIRHILPNISGTIVVMATMWLAAAIRIESSLSFLGLGVSPPTPTWGNILFEAMRYLDRPWLAVWPGLAILITTIAFNMVGDGIRDMTDPRLR